LSLKSSGHENVIKIPNPIGKELESKICSKTRTEYIKAENSVLFVGHVVRQKGVFDLVEACTPLERLKRLTLAGPFEMNARTELLDYAKKRDQGKWLELKGEVVQEEVLRLMCQHEMLVLPSYSEGFPNVVLEAMSMGCPVIAYGVGAIPEMLAIESNNPCGICVPEKNIQKLGEAILALLDDPEKAAWLGKNGRERVLEKYTMDRVVKQYEAVWRNAFSNGWTSTKNS
jgi:glycosyltransferase involved in cell wall biosynthesis